MPGYSFDFWEAFFLPKGTPEPVVNAWHAAVIKALKDPGVARQLANFGFDVIGSTPRELADKLNADITKYAEVARKAKMAFD